jgi:hypothetical protein
MRQRLYSSLLLLLLLVSCAARKPGDPIKPGFNTFSKEQDIQLGREAAAQIRKQIQVVPDQSLQSYVGTVGQRLASQPAADDYPYEFTLIHDSSINAFALPGGPIFVHSGLLRAADNESQLAGVLAHEISHVALRHATNQASKANLIQLPAILAGAAIGQESILAQLSQIGLGFGVNAVMLKYSRDAERQADALGTRIMHEAGYNPIAMADFFEKLSAEGGARAPEFLSSHPDPGNRTEAVLAEIKTLPQRQYAANTGRFDDMKRELVRLPRREPEQTRMRPASGPAPTGFEPLNARDFRMVRPSQWQVVQDQRSGSVAIAPRQGIFRNSYGTMSLGYGAILSYYRPDSGNLRNGTSELINQLQMANPDLQVAGTRQIAVDGQPAMVSRLIGRSPFGGREQNLVLTAMRPQGLFYMVFVAPEHYAAELQPVFERMTQSLQFQPTLSGSR